MTEEHTHDHGESEYITLVDENGNEALFEILMTIDGEEDFANKQYVLLYPNLKWMTPKMMRKK